MTTKQKLELRRSELRSRLAEIAGLDELTDEIRTESKAAGNRVCTDLETKYRAALAFRAGQRQSCDETVDDPSGEQKLRSGWSLERANPWSTISRSPSSQNEVASGSPEAELRSELLGKNALPGHVPLAVLAPSAMEDRKRETRATDAATVTLPPPCAMSEPCRSQIIRRDVRAWSATQFPRHLVCPQSESASRPVFRT